MKFKVGDKVKTNDGIYTVLEYKDWLQAYICSKPSSIGEWQAIKKCLFAEDELSPVYENNKCEKFDEAKPICPNFFEAFKAIDEYVHE